MEAEFKESVIIGLFDTKKESLASPVLGQEGVLDILVFLVEKETSLFKCEIWTVVK